MCKEKKWGYVSKKVLITFIIVVVLFCIGETVHILYNFKKFNEIDIQLSRLSPKLTFSYITNNEEQKILDFLQTEIQDMKEDAQSTENRIIVLVGIIGAVEIFTLSFTGFSNRNEISNTISQKLELEINKADIRGVVVSEVQKQNVLNWSRMKSRIKISVN